jgi:hypothetical protein
MTFAADPTDSDEADKEYYDAMHQDDYRIKDDIAIVWILRSLIFMIIEVVIYITTLIILLT